MQIYSQPFDQSRAIGKNFWQCSASRENQYALDDGLGQVFRREMRDLLESQFKLHVLGNLERRLQKALGLDEFQLDPGLSDGEVRLELGKYISKDVFVAFTQTVYPHLGNQWHMDYKLNHGLRLSTTWDGDGDYQVGIEVRLDF